MQLSLHVLFNNNYELLHDCIDIQSNAPMTEKEYQVGGSTALLDALGKTILRIREKQEPMKKEFRGKALLFIVTDGEGVSLVWGCSSMVSTAFWKK